MSSIDESPDAGARGKDGNNTLQLGNWRIEKVEKIEIATGEAEMGQKAKVPGAGGGGGFGGSAGSPMLPLCVRSIFCRFLR